ncbi:SH3 domain-containing protein [Clostridium ganghwense]|uniref:SH3 domain-containing protein n=1 Tax=Clostridium ganghwense TaxID=312089 RepID=A0ABT4CPQ0_9CLOT|nr:SH3 domain-containing protein [Clostridium ganghwense]MCY6371032.1 SH3 domain-containing protein [Clostridium ganghwense]
MKNKKILSAILAFSIALSPIVGSTSLAKTINSPKGMVTTSTNLNVRKGPSLESQILFKLEPNSSVKIVDTIGDWYKIKLNSSYGYVYKQYIEIDKSSTQEKEGEESKHQYDKIVDTDKVWKINFNKEIEIDASTKNEIKVKDSKDNPISVNIELGDDSKSILVSSPVEGYKLGEGYTLTVGTNIKSVSGSKLKQSKEVSFGVRKHLEQSLGLGKYETEYVHNDREYEWYIDQFNTGTHNYENCGPSSVTMAIKWANPSFDKTAQDARNTYRSEGGWWYTYDITNYLDKYKIENYVVEDITENSVKNQLKDGNVLILCIDSNYITYNPNKEEHVGRHYEFGGGHFIVIKGYKVVDDKTYFEVYDPNSWGEVYENGSKKGKDRYYSSEDVRSSMDNWWPYMIVVSSNNNGGYSRERSIVNTKDIKHMPGK